LGGRIINGHEALARAHREWTEEVLNFEGLRRKEMWMRRSPRGDNFAPENWAIGPNVGLYRGGFSKISIVLPSMNI
jgi:hypothetical protein